MILTLGSDFFMTLTHSNAKMYIAGLIIRTNGQRASI